MKHGGQRGQLATPYRAVLLTVLFLAVALLSYRSALGIANTAQTAGDAPAAAPLQERFPSGAYLTAFVFVASDCGYSTHPSTVEALRSFVESFRARGDAYANVSLIGVAIDEDVEAGVQFLRSLESPGSRFDEISVGRSWLNEQVTRFVWREGVLIAALPQILVVQREVDARPYPRHIDVQRDTAILNVMGRDDILRWVADGTPLPDGR
jgi:hypothetical protein